MQQLLPWILAALSVACLGVAGMLFLLRRRRPRSRPLPDEWTLTPRPVFSTDERRVYRQLREALPHHIVLSKLPLVRFCQPTDPQQVRFWYDLLGASHVTFAICSANGRVLAAIDLDNERAVSQRSMQIKQSVLAACRVRYLRCAPDLLPSIAELQLMVPQTGSAARGAQPAPTVSQAHVELAGTVAQRRRERKTLWQDSGFMQDSFFGNLGRGELGGASTFGAPRGGVSVRELPPPPDEIGGVVIDTPVSPVRH